MEPLSVIATLCGVITALHAVYQWWHHFVAKTKENASEKALHNAFMRTWNKYNRIASVMGKNFQLSFNENLYFDLKVLAPKLKALQHGLKELEASKHNFVEDSSAQNKFNEKFMVLTQYTEDIQARTEDALDKLYKGKLAEADLAMMENQRLEDIEPARQFCEGAKRFQSGDKNEDDISEIVARSPSKNGWGYICECCGLEVGYYPAIRISSTGGALDSSILLTASHLVAFKSIKERRAFYRCLQCYKNRDIIDLPSALAFEKHMEKHPDFTLIKKQDEIQKLRYMVARQEEFIEGVEATKDGPEETVVEDTATLHYPASGTSTESDKINDRSISREARGKDLGVRGVARRKVSALGQEDEDTLRLSGMELSFTSDYGNNWVDEDQDSNYKLLKHTLPGRSAEKVQSKRSQFYEPKQDMPGTFPSGASATSSAAISDFEMDSTHGANRNPITDGASIHSDVIRNNLQSGTSRPLFTGEPVDETASLPIGLVEKPSEPRSGVMSPAPADPLARVSPAVPPRRPAAHHAQSRSSGGSNASPPGHTPDREVSSLGIQQQRNQYQSDPNKPPGSQPFRYQNKPSERAAPQVPQETQQQSVQSTSPERTDPQPPSATQQGLQNMQTERSPPSTSSKSKSSSAQNTTVEQVKQPSASKTTVTISRNSVSGTWEALAGNKFVYCDVDGNVLKDQANPPLDQWIRSKAGYQGQTGMHWAMKKSSNEVVFAAQDPR